MNKYRLDIKPSSYYSGLFREDEIEIVPSYDRSGIILREYQEQGMCEIGEEFGIYFPSENNKVDREYIEIAKNVLSQIAELDAEARSITGKDNFDHEEYLAYIEIGKDEIELNYFASTVNTEWGAYFKRQSDGNWRLEKVGAYLKRQPDGTWKSIYDSGN